MKITNVSSGWQALTPSQRVEAERIVASMKAERKARLDAYNQYRTSEFERKSVLVNEPRIVAWVKRKSK